MNKVKKTIGILGGMGPSASAKLYQDIIKIAQESYGAVQDEDFPPMIIYNLPLAGFDGTGFVDEASIKNQLIQGVKKLEKFECDFIIIACNTVHFCFNDLQKSIGIPIISIIKETVTKAKNDGCEVVGILSSETTNRLNIYSKELQKQGIKPLELTKSEQIKVNRVILNAMAGRNDINDTNSLLQCIDALEKKGAQGIVLGCTELPLVILQSDVSLKVYDCTEIIAKAALEYALK